MTALQALRKQASLTQREVADRVNAAVGRPHGGPVTYEVVSRWERGIQVPQVHYQRALCTVYGVDTDQLGLEENAATDPLADLIPEPAITAVMDPRVTTSQDQWRRTRRALNTNRPALAQLAADTYPENARFDSHGLLVGPGWIPDAPIPLDDIRLEYRSDWPAASVTGMEPEAQHVRPCQTLTQPYQRYTAAIRDLETPRLFANRETWRMVGVDMAARKLTFGPTSYFAAVDVCEAVAHETAMVALDARGRLRNEPLPGRNLPFRRLIGNPFSPARLVTPAAISTLTIRGGTEPTFLLHRRDSKSVAIAGGALQVIPSGVFQPSSVPAVLDADFDLFRNIAREFSEELLGNPEHDGDGVPADYDAEPLATLGEAYRSGRMRIHCLGAGLDGLTLFGEILTVAVLDPDLYDDLAQDFVAINEEGSVVASRLPFDGPTVTALLESGRMHPAGAGCLALAWQYRQDLLSK